MCIDKNYLNVVLEIFNSYNNHTQFTYKIEQNKSINFLDITIIIDKNRILTNWYQKHTCSGR